MFSFENYLPMSSFNESSVFFKALEVFRYGFLVDSTEGNGEFRQLYSYHYYYVEIVYRENYEEIQDIHAIPLNETLEKYVDNEMFHLAFNELTTA